MTLFPAQFAFASLRIKELGIGVSRVRRRLACRLCFDFRHHLDFLLFVTPRSARGTFITIWNRQLIREAKETGTGN
jgi:hypothetical protein